MAPPQLFLLCNAIALAALVPGTRAAWAWTPGKRGNCQPTIFKRGYRDLDTAKAGCERNNQCGAVYLIPGNRVEYQERGCSPEHHNDKWCTIGKHHTAERCDVAQGGTTYFKYEVKVATTTITATSTTKTSSTRTSTSKTRTSTTETDTTTTTTTITTTTTTSTTTSTTVTTYNPVDAKQRKGGTTAAIVIVVVLLVGTGVLWGRRQWLAHNAESNRREQAILEVNGGGGGMEMVENPLARSASRTLPTVPTYENVAEQQLQPANDRADVPPPPLIPASRHGAPRAATPQLYSTPADLDPASLYTSPADADGAAAAGVQVQAQVYSVPTDGGGIDLYQPADGGHAYAESPTLNKGGNAGEGGGVEYATVHEDDAGVYSNA